MSSNGHESRAADITAAVQEFCDSGYRELVESLPVGFLVRDVQDDSIVYASPFLWQLAGFDATDVLPGASPFADLVVAEDQSLWNAEMARIEATHGFQLDLRCISRQGKPGWVRTVCKLITDAADVPLRCLILVHDITESKNVEKRSANSQKLEAIGQLAAGIAHEINTPSQYVLDNIQFLRTSFAELLDALADVEEIVQVGAPTLLEQVHKLLAEQDIDYLREEIPTAIDQSIGGMQQVKKIVASMKDFSHSGENFEEVDLNRLIESACTVCRNEWAQVAELTLQLGDGLSAFRCVPNAINQALLNMVINAAHAIESKQNNDGEITITSSTDGTFAEITIADNGAGIEENILENIFDHFFTTKGIGKGTGQGLAIAYEIITKQHNGTITVSSQVGVGTEFNIKLAMNGSD